MNLQSWNRFLTDAFQVVPDVMGATHRFIFDGSAIEVTLPSEERAAPSSKRDQVASAGPIDPTTNKPKYYSVAKVDVAAHLNCSVVLPSQILNVPPTAFDLVTDDTKEILKTEIQKHGELAIRAFNHWISIVQWVAADFRIGRGRFNSVQSGWGTHMQEVGSLKTVWVEGGAFKVPLHSTITVEHWREIDVKLQAGSTPPIHTVLRLEAEYFFSLRDFRRSLMDTAIACETFLRSKVLTTIPAGLMPMQLDQIEKANIAQYVNQLFPEILDVEAGKKYDKIKPELNSLFAKRNDLFHRGNREAATAENCLRFLGELRKLFTLVPDK